MQGESPLFGFLGVQKYLKFPISPRPRSPAPSDFADFETSFADFESASPFLADYDTRNTSLHEAWRFGVVWMSTEKQIRVLRVNSSGRIGVFHQWNSAIRLRVSVDAL